MEYTRSYHEYLALFSEHGGTPEDYLADHYGRFIATLDEFRSTWTHTGGRVIDIGAHWLHQAVMWRQAGFEVTAVDLPGTFAVPSVQSAARAMNIPLIACQNLEHADELRAIPDDSMDIVLFTEILEHITFNPNHFWSEVYRILAPGGRIVVTTPNYYSWRGRAWQFLRYVSGRGGGISVDQVLKTHTYAHHWREYSRKEVLRYFHLISPDFMPVKARLMPTYAYSRVTWKRAVQRVLDQLPLLRPNLHVEIDLPQKKNGVTITASW
jgi:2-polyprenyl-6-hydroxyphenyl methylase/3-demethylubiquinone-9 3-methyltransferase